MPAKIHAAMVLALLVNCGHQEPAPAVATLDLPKASAPADRGPPQRAEGPAPVADAGESTDGGLRAESPPRTPPVEESASPVFASYLRTMHDRIHPIFADQFLAQLATLRTDHLLNDPRLVVILEIRLARSGAIDRLGIIRTSGVTAFDIATLDSVVRAGPFAKPPSEARSFDGKVYVQWEFHRDGQDGCAVANARPFVRLR
jgi:TonB family protein